MGEQVERLQASWISEVSRVSMSTQCYICVSGVGEGEVGDKIVEASIMRLSDKSDLLQ